MGLSEVEKKIQEIEERSNRRYDDLFKSASNGKRILKEDAERYEKLLQDKEKLRQYEEFVKANQAIISKYNMLHSELKSSGITVPEIKAETAALVGPIQTSEKKEIIGVEPPKKEETTMALEPVGEYSYRLKRGEIIQDLPIQSKDEQKFASPGMTKEEIAFSRGKLDGIGIVDSATYVDPIEAEIERRKAEYEAQKKAKHPEVGPVVPPVVDVPKGPSVTPEVPVVEIPEEPVVAAPVPGAPQPPKKEFEPIPIEQIAKEAEKVANAATKKKSRKKKVKNRRKFDWSKLKDGFKNKITDPIKSAWNKSTIVLKGLFLSENLTNKSKSYQQIYPMILALRATYKHRPAEVNMRELVAIDRTISSKTDLTLSEKKRLLTKLSALHKSIEKQMKKQQSKAVDAGVDAIDDLDEELSLGRR